MKPGLPLRRATPLTITGVSDNSDAFPGGARPGGRYALSESAQVCIGARPTGAFPLVMSGDGIDYSGGVIR